MGRSDCRICSKFFTLNNYICFFTKIFCKRYYRQCCKRIKIERKFIMFTQSQIDQFHHDGTIVAKNLIRGKELEKLQEAADKVVNNAIENKPQDISNNEEEKEFIWKDLDGYMLKKDGRHIYRRSSNMFDRDPVFKAVCANPEMLKHYGQLIGHSFVPADDAMVVKVPHGDVPVLWHQDPPYLRKDWDKLQRIPNIDCDIYLDHSTKENGCLWGIPNHHLVGHIEIENFTEEELFNCPGIIPFETEPGDVIFHSLSAPHGSAGNKTNGLRRTFYIHFNNKEIYEQCYAGSSAAIKRKEQRDGWFYDFDEKTKNKLIEMNDLRRSMGFDMLKDDEILISNEGFEYVGEGPKTPPYHWETLTKKIDPERRKELKKLEIIPR
ncbi:MAG: hypothetical protein CL564_02310 [Alphaproteobacteria bacterium]|nr:hypothetical protein [Alphaproteobacteria bacterium]